MLARLKAGADQADDIWAVPREVLRLQRAGGNRAVGSLLAREEREDRPVDKTLIVPEPIGVLPVESFSYGGNPKTELHVMVPHTEWTWKLLEWATDGTALPVVKVSTRRYTVTVTDALLAGFQVDPISLVFSGKVDIALN